MKIRVLSALVASFIFVLAAGAELKLPSVIGDHMVLQQGVRAPIWGWSDPGQTVVVGIAGQETRATADANGKWLATLKPLAAGGPHVLTISVEGAAAETKSIQDVLVGEVWVASGQSNMEWPLRLANNPEQEIAAANHPNIRFIQPPHVVADTPQTNIEGEWKTCTSETSPSFSAVAYFFARALQEELKVPIGIIHTSWGGTPSEAWTSIETLQSLDTAKPTLARWEKTLADYPEAQKAYEIKQAEYEEAARKAKEAGTEAPARPQPPMGPDHPHRPATLYNAMIAPYVPYGIRGAIWYQGESNAGRAFQYRTIFPAMIEDWRKAWGGEEFPFLFVQLANFMDRQDAPQDPSAWAELREAQSMTLSLKNTGMATIIDIGEAKDIHPRNKQDVGKRLALAAFKVAYDKNVPYSGPVFKSIKIKGNEARLKFSNADDGLKTANDGPLKGFAIAGEDRKFVWADARIEGKRIVVSSPSVPAPVAVRYGWADNPECTLYNGAGLPASPFRTDDWPASTEKNF